MALNPWKPESDCRHLELNLSFLEEATQKFDTTAPNNQWLSGQEPTGTYYVTGATCLDCGKDNFTPQEVANLTRLAVYKNKSPPLICTPEPYER